MKPYIIGEFAGVPFTIDSTYQVACENPEAKQVLKELLIEGLKEYNEEKSWSKMLPQFYVKSALKNCKKNSIELRKIFVYKNGSTIKYIEDQYIPNEPTIYIEGTLILFPFIVYTDFSVVCNAPEPDGTGIANWVRGDLEKLRMEYQSPAVPNIHNKLCYELMKLPFYKIKKAIIYKSYYDPNVIY